ncbi:MAG TPA: M15 family metallopeptidase [Candidatus Paceibacterota bacterium]
MMEYKNIKKNGGSVQLWVALSVVLIIVAGGFVYSYVKITALDKQVLSLSENLASTTATLYGTAGSLSNAQNEIASAKSNIDEVKDKVGGVEQTVGSISGTVSTLQKLSTIDPELLKKYSKVYFLNENYTPAHLKIIPQEYVYSNTVQEQFLEEAWPFLQNLLTAAKADNVAIYVKSGFRSFAEQKKVKSEFTVVYGAGTANSFSADQGYSEHQLGTAVDFITGGFGGELTEDFDTTAAFKWLKDNAYKFGFELSYPEKNAYYTYEPWHWRFVGVKLSTYLHTRGINFYDLDQRDIDTYLVNLLD